MQKYGKKNNIQRYFCSSCHKTFSSTNKLNPIDIWTDYTIGKQTYLNIIADVTFFGRDFGVLVLMDTLSKKVVYHRVVKTEKDLYYKLAEHNSRKRL
ncbi:IS1/IS1595 family N-terminal zinc-binding domain-containing protein [Gallibacterium anatis]|uniref:IS1/IS1595 family N-terminal zinc-binding domain-containing protein n=1 Tax=Gallibacterium anatis TaxID=750 RepID=UPI003D7B33B3